MAFFQKYQTIWKKAGIAGGVYLAMKYLVPLMIPFLIAALAAYWVRPLFLKLERYCKIKPAFSAMVFLVIFVGGMSFLLYFLLAQLGGLASRFLVNERPDIYIEQVLLNCCQAAERMLGFPAEQVEYVLVTQFRVFADEMQASWMPKAMDGSMTAVKGVGKALAAVLITAISFVMWSGDFEKIREEASGLVLWQKAVRLAKGVLEAIGGYVRAQCIIILLIMGACTTGFFFAGSPYALLFGICTGILDALPVLGTGIVILPWLLVQILQGNYGAAFILALTYGACTVIREVLEPRLVGKRLGLFPILVLMSVYVGVKLYGMSGIVLGPISLLVIQELWREMEPGERK